MLEDSDDFIFDNQMLLQVFYYGFSVGEISCPTLYNKDASSINFRRSLIYGIGVLFTALQYVIAKSGLAKMPIFAENGRKIIA